MEVILNSKTRMQTSGNLNGKGQKKVDGKWTLGKLSLKLFWEEKAKTPEINELYYQAKSFENWTRLILIATEKFMSMSNVIGLSISR